MLTTSVVEMTTADATYRLCARPTTTRKVPERETPPKRPAAPCGAVPRNDIQGPVRPLPILLGRQCPWCRPAREGLHPFQQMGTTVRMCTVEGCDRKHCAKGLCYRHYKKLWKYDSVNGRPRQQHGALGPSWTGEDATYKAVHIRLRTNRGRASRHTCSECDRQALDWSYTHDCPNEQQSERGPYSTDLSRYQPMCRPCHKKLDQNRHQLVA